MAKINSVSGETDNSNKKTQHIPVAKREKCFWCQVLEDGTKSQMNDDETEALL